MWLIVETKVNSCFTNSSSRPAIAVFFKLNTEISTEPEVVLNEPEGMLLYFDVCTFKISN